MSSVPVEVLRTASQRYYQSHKDKRREYGREYYEKNKERILEAAALKREARRQARDASYIPPPPPPPPEENQSSPLRNFKRRGVHQEPALTISFN